MERVTCNSSVDAYIGIDETERRFEGQQFTKMGRKYQFD
jgi:hypothetical protein